MLARVPFAAVAALAIATAVAASPEAAPTNPCRAALPQGPAVPAPIVLWNSCGRFRLDADGGVIRLSRRWLARHRDGTGRRYEADLRLRNTRQGEIVILRQQRTIWRSSGLYKNEGGSLAFGPGLFAFSSYRRGVYVTDLHHPERLVIRGSGLYPLDFRRDGKLIVVGRGLIWVVSPTGKTLHRYPYRRPSGLAFDSKRDRFYFVTPDGTLATADGGRARRLGPTPPPPGLVSISEPGLLVWQGQHHVTVTRRDGAFVASASWPTALGTSDSGVTPSRDAKLFAYRVTNARAGARRARASLFSSALANTAENAFSARSSPGRSAAASASRSAGTAAISSTARETATYAYSNRAAAGSLSASPTLPGGSQSRHRPTSRPSPGRVSTQARGVAAKLAR